MTEHKQTLEAKLAEAAKRFNDMPPDQQRDMLEAQRQSYIRGELGMPETSVIARPRIAASQGEPADALETIRHLRARVSALTDALEAMTADRDEAHRAGYEIAREDAARVGWHLVRYDVAMGRKGC